MIGKAPACIECAHLQLKRAVPAVADTEHVREVDGLPMIFLCGRASDPLTGNSPESCHTERQVGLCGPRGLFFEQSDMPELASIMAADDDPDFAEVETLPPVVEPGEEFEDDD